jgi:hypothetical protein
MHEVMLDENLPERRRRSELRACARAMAVLMPRARLRRAEKALRNDAHRVKATAGPSLEAPPKVSGPRKAGE